MTNCPNCGAPFTGGKCKHCGTERLEFRPRIEQTATSISISVEPIPIDDGQINRALREVAEKVEEQKNRIVDRAAFAEWVLWVGSFVLAVVILAALLIYLL